MRCLLFYFGITDGERDTKKSCSYLNAHNRQYCSYWAVALGLHDRKYPNTVYTTYFTQVPVKLLSNSTDCCVNSVVLIINAIPKIRFTLLSRSGSFLKNRYNVVKNIICILPFPYGVFYNCGGTYKYTIHLFSFTASSYCRYYRLYVCKLVP